MNDQFIFKSCLNLALQGGASEDTAKAEAGLCAERWKRGQYTGKVLTLIEEHAKKAAAITGKQRLAKNRKARKQEQTKMF